MKKLLLLVLLVIMLTVVLSGCIHWETNVKYELLFDPSEIESILVYAAADNYNYSDPIEPCGELLGEIPAEQYAVFTEELTGLPFVEPHLIILFPVTYDPNFYYGNYIVKIEYHDGSCELISDIIQRQFRVNEKYSDTFCYSAGDEAWLVFLKNWVELPD